jgi:hypothetical protein
MNVKLPRCAQRKRRKVSSFSKLQSSNIRISRWIRIRDSFQVLPIDEGFDTLLDHVDVWDESSGKLGEDFGDEL